MVSGSWLGGASLTDCFTLRAIFPTLRFPFNSDSLFVCLWNYVVILVDRILFCT